MPVPAEQGGELLPADEMVVEDGEKDRDDVMEEPVVEDDEVMDGGGGAAWEIDYTDDGFVDGSTINFTVEKGEPVFFNNVSSRAFWPASNVHPAHTILPGFDSLGPVEPGEYYIYTFEKEGKWPFHDHMRPSLGGVITVQ